MNKIINDYCTFCERRENVPNQLFAESDNFFAFFTLGHMVEGYTLIVSKEHYHCMGALPQSLQAEYLEFTKYITGILEKKYGRTISYEHGRVGLCNVQPGEQICYHAHTHIVPVAMDLIPDFKKDGLIPYEIEQNSSLFKQYKNFGHYLYYRNIDKKEYIIQINQPIRRQYLRYLVAKNLGNEELAKWSEYPEYVKLNSAIKNISNLITEKKVVN